MRWIVWSPVARRMNTKAQNNCKWRFLLFLCLCHSQADKIKQKSVCVGKTSDSLRLSFQSYPQCAVNISQRRERERAYVWTHCVQCDLAGPSEKERTSWTSWSISHSAWKYVHQVNSKLILLSVKRSSDCARKLFHPNWCTSVYFITLRSERWDEMKKCWRQFSRIYFAGWNVFLIIYESSFSYFCQVDNDHSHSSSSKKRKKKLLLKIATCSSVISILLEWLYQLRCAFFSSLHSSSKSSSFTRHLTQLLECVYAMYWEGEECFC